jgi:arylsulfatase A-like enzyme
MQRPSSSSISRRAALRRWASALGLLGAGAALTRAGRLPSWLAAPGAASTASGQSAGQTGPEIPPARPNGPNVILIVTDDEDADAESIAAMPRLKSYLTDQGTTFANSFVNVPLCCPSRSSILRGQYAHNHGVLSNHKPRGSFERFHALGSERSTVATWLQAAGYRTVLLGKYLNGYPSPLDPTYVPPGWDEWASPVGGTEYIGYNYRLNENGAVVAYGNRPEDYLTDVLAGKATDFIRRTADDNRPFFMYLAPRAPHTPAAPALRHQDEYSGVMAPRPPSFNEEEVSDKPDWVRSKPPLSPDQIAEIDELYRRRLQSMLAVDEMLDAIVGALQATGRLENTYLIFTSDNGFQLGQHRVDTGKRTAYEGSIRVPLIVRGPGVPAARVIDDLAVNIDLAPTVAELAGAPVPEFVDGRSLVPLLTGSSSPADWRRAFLVEYWPEAGDEVSRFQALRTQDHLYVEYQTGERELYDLSSDPDELESLYPAADPGLVAKLSARMAELRRCAGANCRAAEMPAP